MNYLMAPFESTNVSMYDKGFESKLYLLTKESEIVWSKTIGYSNKSSASPLKVDNNFIYTGEAQKETRKVVIQKLDINGTLVWKTELDSLDNVNAIYIDSARVSLLVSFDYSERVNNKDGTFSENIYPVYYFVQLEVSTGKRIKKEYQLMANYLSRKGFSNALINTDYSYFLNNKDSAIFLNVTKQESATVVSQELSPQNEILNLIAGLESYHLLTAYPEGKAKKTYNLISNFYGTGKKYQSRFPVDFNSSDRRLIYKKATDTIVTVINSPQSISIFLTDPNGQTILSKKIIDSHLPVIAVGETTQGIFMLQMEGRNKPGLIGKLKLVYY